MAAWKRNLLWETSPLLWLPPSDIHRYTWSIQSGWYRGRLNTRKEMHFYRGKNSVLYNDNMGEWERNFLVLYGNNFSISSCLFFSVSFIIPSPCSWNIYGRQKRTACPFGSQLPPLTIFNHQEDEVEPLLDWNKKKKQEAIQHFYVCSAQLNGVTLDPMFTFWKSN